MNSAEIKDKDPCPQAGAGGSFTAISSVTLQVLHPAMLHLPYSTELK